MNIYSNIILFGETYLISMFMYFIILGKKRKNKLNYTSSVDLSYIIQRYKLNINKLEYKLFVSIMNVSNSFIIATTLTIMLNIKKYVYRIAAGFVIIIVLIYVFYALIGKYFKKKEE